MGLLFSFMVLFFLILLFQFSLEVPPFSEEVFVVDNLFTSDEIRYMKSLLSQEETLWMYGGKRNVAMDGENEVQTATSCLCWSTEIDSENFMDLSEWAKISNTLSARLDVSREWNVLAHKVRGEVNIRGCQTCSTDFGGRSGVDGANYTAVIFLVQNWGRNFYGELIAYDKKGEITGAIHPRHGRMVVIPAVLEHLIKPPAINIPERLYYLYINIKLSKVEQSTRKPKAAPTDNSQENKFPELLPSFNLLTESADGLTRDKLEIQKFVTRNFTTSDGRHVIVVLDGVLPSEELDALSRTVLTRGYNDNPAGSDSTDNVQWIMSFEVEDFVQKSLWHLISQIVTFVSGREGYYPYDISCNNIQRGDTTTIHQDCAEEENEFTLLIYLNQNWTENHHGETVFFSNKEGSEVVFAVRPRYGRVLIFHGDIPHSARPPTMTEAGW